MLLMLFLLFYMNGINFRENTHHYNITWKLGIIHMLESYLFKHIFRILTILLHHLENKIYYNMWSLKQIEDKTERTVAVLAWSLILFHVTLHLSHSCQTNILPKSNLLSIWSLIEAHAHTHASTNASEYTVEKIYENGTMIDLRISILFSKHSNK